MYDVLFAPERGEYHGEESPDVECIFCAIRDKDSKIWTREIYRDEKAIVIMNIYPYSPGHIQVLPCRHVENPEDLPADEFVHMLETALKGMELVKKVMDPVGWNLGINLGKAGASISHLHMQIVPRYNRKISQGQEEIHNQYLDELEFFEEPREIESVKKTECECLSDIEFVFKEEPHIYLSDLPYNRGHLVVSPDYHVENPMEITAEDFFELFKGINKGKRAIEDVYDPVGLNIGMNIGAVQNSSEHLKLHLVPRYDPESGFMEVVGNSRVVIEPLQKTFDKLKSSIG